MADFPTLSRKPSFPIAEKPLDTDSKSSFEGGYEQGRVRYTRNLFEYELDYPYLTAADAVLLKAFRDLVKSTAIFNWTHPIDNVTKEVRFVKRPEIVAAGRAGGGIYYTTKFTLRMA